MAFPLLVALAGLALGAAASVPPPREGPLAKPLRTCLTELVAFRDEREGLRSTSCGQLLRTRDGGRTWQEDVALRDLLLAGAPRPERMESPGERPGLWHLTHLVWLTSRTAVATGLGEAWAFRTEDGGETWVRALLPAAQTFRALEAVGERVWMCGDSGRIVRSDDLGRSWRDLPGTPFGEKDHCKVLSFVDAQDGWAGGMSGRLWRTTNGGETWEPLPAPDDHPSRLRLAPSYKGWKALQRITPQLAWGWTESGRYLSRDGGQTWQQRPKVRASTFVPVLVRAPPRLPWIERQVAGRPTAVEQREPAFDEALSPWGEDGVVTRDLVFYRAGKQVRAAPPLVEKLLSDSEGVLVRVKEAEGNIMPADFVAQHQRHDPPAAGEKLPTVRAWKPSIADILRFERSLEPFLLRTVGTYPYGTEAELPEIVRRISRGHLRQYYGVTVNGRKRLHVELIAPEMLPPSTRDGSVPTWRTVQPQVVDAGLSYIWVDYDVKRGEYEGFGTTGSS